MHPPSVAVDRGTVVAAGADKDVALEEMPGYFTCRTTCIRHWRLRICQVCQVSSLLLRAATGDVLVATAQVPSYRSRRAGGASSLGTLGRYEASSESEEHTSELQSLTNLVC